MAKKGLGRGLNALFGTDDAPAVGVSETAADSSVKQDNEGAGGVNEINISMIEPNVKQARKTFDDEKLESLADSIREHGIIQPILAVESGYGTYRIVAGERRWRAAKNKDAES